MSTATKITTETIKTKCRHGWIKHGYTYIGLSSIVCTDQAEGTTTDDYVLVAEVDLGDPDLMADIVMAQIENIGENPLTFKITATLPGGKQEMPVVSDTQLNAGAVHVDIRQIPVDTPPGPALYRIYVKSTNAGSPTTYNIIIRTLKNFK